MDKMVWVDLETTGLDPRKEEILEIGIKITDLELKQIGPGFEMLFNPWGSHLEEAISSLDPFIIEMHTKSELWHDIRRAGTHAWNAFDKEAGSPVSKFLKEHDALGLPMCGNNVPFDRAFLTQHLPKVAELFHYRNLDVSSLKNAYVIECALDMQRNPRLSEEEGDFPQWESPESKHRALPDLDVSIMEYQFYREHLFR